MKAYTLNITHKLGLILVFLALAFPSDLIAQRMGHGASRGGGRSMSKPASRPSNNRATTSRAPSRSKSASRPSTSSRPSTANRTPKNQLMVVIISRIVAITLKTNQPIEARIDQLQIELHPQIELHLENLKLQTKRDLVLRLN